MVELGSKPKIKKIRYKERTITGVPRRLRLSEANSSRNVNCPYYDSCLEIAIKYEMRSFICVNCKYKDTKKSEVE